MEFIKIGRTGTPQYQGRRRTYLMTDNWDDYGFSTLFDASIFDDEGQVHELGGVKIMSAGLESGYVQIPDAFEALGENYCSLGQDQNYYEMLAVLPEDLRVEFLVGLRDCVHDDAIWEAFRDEKAMGTSLMRSVSRSAVEKTYRNVLAGHAAATSFKFEYIIGGDEEEGGYGLEVDVKPESTPPTNIHAVIGRNGVGKTRLFAGIAHSLTQRQDPTDYAAVGALSFLDDRDDEGEKFANLVTVSFSAFDSFRPIESRLDGDIRCAYVGLRRYEAVEEGEEERIGTKSSDDLTAEFRSALATCLKEPRRSRWAEMMQYISSDPGISALGIQRLLNEDSDNVISNTLVEEFKRLSSGHKIVLLTSTRLVELVDEKTLVLIDEPESHLHPPLLGSFIRAIAKLLTQRNGVGVLATHSPVVLQEVPRSCVTVLSRAGDIVRADRPEDETFAENVSTLTREVFGLEVSESGYHKLLAQASEASTYRDVLRDFSDQIGTEGRAIVRALTNINRDD